MDNIESDKDRIFNKARELKNSTILRKYKSSNYPGVISVVDYLFDEMVDVYGLNLIRKSSVDKLKSHIEFFVLNLYKTFCKDPTRVISFPRDRSKYSDKKSMYKRKLGLSFRYSVEEGENGKGVINFLEKQGYIETFGFQHDKNNPNQSFQSRMRATGRLIDLIVTQYEVSEQMIEYDTSGEETVVVKGVKPKPRWISYIDAKGKKRRKKIKGKRKPCKTPDKPIVREMRKNLEIINEVMDKADIRLDISEKELRKLNARLLDDPDPYKQAVDYSRKRLHRVFLDRRFDRGGRFYGPWYQNIPKEYRQHITIDGAPTLELDYSALHPNLLYYYAGVNPPEGDLYKLDGYSEDTRKFLKAFFLRIINSKSKTDAKGSIREAAIYKKKVTIPTELGNLGDEYLDPLIDKFLEKHKALKDYIFIVKDLGNILQCVDSMIAEKFLLYFALQGIPVLPLHDSFRIDARAFTQLEWIMNRVIIENFSRLITISNDDFKPLIENLWNKLAQGLEDGTYDMESASELIKDIKASVEKIKRNQRKLEKLRNKDTVNCASN